MGDEFTFYARQDILFFLRHIGELKLVDGRWKMMPLREECLESIQEGCACRAPPAYTETNGQMPDVEKGGQDT